MQVLSSQQAAELLGVSTRRLYQIAKEADPPPKDSTGKYPCREFGKWLTARHVTGMGIQTDGRILDLNAERARLAKEQADKAAMENARLRGEMVPVSSVRGLLEKVLSTFKTRILSIPTRLATEVIGIKATMEARDKIEEHLHEALHELSRLDISELRSTSIISGSEAAAETDGQPMGGPEQKIKRGSKRGTGAVEN